MAAAFAALADQSYIDNYVKEVVKARDWIKERLINCNVRHHIDGGNYLLIWSKHQGPEIERLLKEQGILVRDMSKKPIITGAIRVSIGTTKQMKKFWDCFYRLEQMPFDQK